MRLSGGGDDGLGEDVSPYDGRGRTRCTSLGPLLPLAGEWTLESFCDRLAALDQWPVAPEYDIARRWRNWAFESAALDLALNQAGRRSTRSSGASRGRCGSSTRSASATRPTFDPIPRRLEHHPGLRFKLDAVPAWTPELIDRWPPRARWRSSTSRAATGWRRRAADLLAMYERVIAAFPDALLEDAHDLPEVAELLAPQADRISYDAPIHTAEDIDAHAADARAVNIKPCRVGDLRSLFAVYDETQKRGLVTYGGGMGEIDVGRGQIQLLASLFHPDGPNDTAPSGYNADNAGAPTSRQPARAARRRRPAFAHPGTAPSTRLCSLRRAAQRAVWESPQSGETLSRSAGACRRHARTRSSTSSGDST